MADMLTARAALGGDASAALRTSGDAASVMLHELPASTMIDLRLDVTDAGVLSAVQAVLAMSLPLTPGKISLGAGRSALWLGPDQWLIDAPAAEAGPLARALSGCAGSAVDVSDLRAGFELTGPRSADVLRKGCAIDLHPRVFEPGDCALTMLARVRVAVTQADTTPTYRILVERSVAQYLWDWLIDAMMEYKGAR